MIFIFIILLFLFFLISWKNLVWGLAVFFTLLPTYLIRFHIGPIPTTFLEILFWILFFVWITKQTKQGSLISNVKLHFSKHPTLFLALSLFLAGATMAIFFSSNLRSALGEWKAFYIEPVLLFFILIQTIKTKQQVHLILKGILFSGFITALLAIYQHFTGWLVPHAFWANRNTYRVTAWYGFPNAVGLFLGPLVPLALYLLTERWKKIQETSYKKQANLNHKSPNLNWLWKLEIGNWKLFVSCVLYLGILSALILAIIYAKSTGTLIGIAAGTGILLLFYKKTRWPAVLLGLAGLVVLFILPANNPIKAELLAQDRSGQIRIQMWGETVELLSDYPITGAGLASYSEKIAPYHTPVNGERIEIFHHPHNIFMTMWVNVGLLGLVGFMWVLVFFYRLGVHLWKLKIGNCQPKADPPWAEKLGIFLMSSMTVILVSGLVDSPYIKNDLAMLFWLIVGLMVVSSSQTVQPYKLKKYTISE